MHHYNDILNVLLNIGVGLVFVLFFPALGWYEWKSYHANKDFKVGSSL
jgi:hypothetical protein